MTKKVITGKELLERGKAAPGKLAAGDVLDVLYMEDDAMRGAAAEALRDPDGTPEWKRRLLAGHLEGRFARYIAERDGKRRGRHPDFKTALKFCRLLIESDVTPSEARKRLLPSPGSDERALRRKIDRATLEARRRTLAAFELILAAKRVIDGE